MRYIIAALLTLFTTFAQAQAPTRLCFSSVAGDTRNCIPVDASNPFPITGSFSLTNPTIGASVPATGVYNALNVGGVLRGLSGLSVGSIFPATVAIVDASGNQITSFGSATTNITQLNSVALGSPSTYGISPGAINVIGINAAVTQSALPTGAATSALQTTINTTLGSPFQAGGALAANQSVNVAQFGGVSTSTGQVAVSTAPVTATNTALVVDLRPDSPGIIPFGQFTKTASISVATASDQLGAQPLSSSFPTNISSQYPVNSVTTTPTAVTATTTGTTAATAAALAATANVTNFVCGFDITADATALATGTATLSGIISGSMSFLQTITAVANGTSQLVRTYNPCIPASGSNIAITITSAAAGTGGNTITNIWGYRL